MNQATTIIEGFVAGRREPRLSGVKTVCAFDFSDAGEEVDVEVDDGRLSIAPPGTHADCTFSCTVDEFLRIFRGEQKLITAIMQGRVAVTGDLSAVQTFQEMLPQPPNGGSKNKGDQKSQVKS